MKVPALSMWNPPAIPWATFCAVGAAQLEASVAHRASRQAPPEGSFEVDHSIGAVGLFAFCGIIDVFVTTVSVSIKQIDQQKGASLMRAPFCSVCYNRGAE